TAHACNATGTSGFRIGRLPCRNAWPKPVAANRNSRCRPPRASERTTPGDALPDEGRQIQAPSTLRMCIIVPDPQAHTHDRTRNSASPPLAQPGLAGPAAGATALAVAAIGRALL